MFLFNSLHVLSNYLFKGGLYDFHQRLCKYINTNGIERQTEWKYNIQPKGFVKYVKQFAPYIPAINMLTDTNYLFLISYKAGIIRKRLNGLLSLVTPVGNGTNRTSDKI